MFRYTKLFAPLLLISLSLTPTAPAQDQSPSPTVVTTPTTGIPIYRVRVVARTTQALNYRHHTTNHLEFQGTNLNPQGKGKAEVESKTGRLNIEASFENLPKASIYGPEFLTYVLWAITPEGRASNLGEVRPSKDGKNDLKVTTDLQAFGMIVTAEPYYAVTIPSDQVILENVFRKNPKGFEQPIDAKFDVLERGEYTVDVPASQLASQTADEKMPLDLKEAINAVAIARAAGATQYASDSLSKAEDFLNRAQDYYRRDQGDKPISTVARGAVQSAEDARLLTIRRKREEQQIAQQRRAEEAETQRQQAEQERQLSEAQRQQAESERQKAEEAKREAEQARQQAEQARAAALAQQQAAEAESTRAHEQAQTAQLQAAEAQREKEATRTRLMQQLNQVLETRESARGLIVSMPDVLFDFGKYTLKGDARERLAKVSGILLAYPGLNVQVEGHTDNVGSDAYNQQLSDERADTVRQFLVAQGVPSANVSAQGFGKTQPVASNDSSEGRQRNRRVELIVNGSALGTSTSQPGTGNGGTTVPTGSNGGNLPADQSGTQPATPTLETKPADNPQTTQPPASNPPQGEGS